VPERQEVMQLLAAGPRASILGWGVQPDSNDKFAQELVVAEVHLTRIGQQGTLILAEDAHAGVCGGDSGGPIIVNDASGRAVLIGIASVTDGNLCAKGGGIAGYTNVGQLRDFIRDNVPDLPPAPPPPRGPKP
jgi:secreted trypsin-like serine protease